MQYHNFNKRDKIQLDLPPLKSNFIRTGVFVFSNFFVVLTLIYLLKRFIASFWLTLTLYIDYSFMRGSYPAKQGILLLKILQLNSLDMFVCYKYELFCTATI